MNKSNAHSKMAKVYTILRLVTIFFAIFGPMAMMCSAVIITLYEGDWWFNLFLAFFAGIIMIFGTLYLSLLTLISEATRYFKNKIKSDLSDTSVVKWMHRFLMGTSIAGLISYIPFLLIFFDVLNGGFAIIHFICGCAILILYVALGINAVIHRKKTYLQD